MPESPTRIEETEDCEELDEDYFASLGNTFAVVDAWNENDEVQIKNEPDEESNHSKASSKKSNNKDPEIKKTSSNRDPRPKEPRPSARSDRNRASADRRRSPDRRRLSLERNRIRLSPRRSPERNRSFRDDRFRRSPPRNVGQFDRRRPASPDRNRNQNAQPKKPFLVEMQEKFMQEGKRDAQIDQMLQQGGRIDLNSPDLRPEPPRNFQNLPMHFNNHQNQMPVFMNEQMMPQHFNPLMMQQIPMQNMHPNMMNMPFPQMNAISPPIPTNMFMNSLEIMQSAPLPVPAPHIEPICPPGSERMQFPQISPPILYHNNNIVPKQPVTIVRENAERAPMKKAPAEEGKNLLDILRQKSKQNTKSSADEELASKKAKVLEACKSVGVLIKDLEQNKSKLPLTCLLSTQSIQKPNVTINKSPLLTSERNPRYLFQATPDQCFSVLENHPLRNIYGETAEIAQYLKFDLHELSSTVARETIIRPPAINVDPRMPSTSGINNDSSSIFAIKKTSTKGVQTEPLTCKKCHQMDIIKQSAKSKACQTNEAIKISAEVQCNNQDGTDGFKVFIDAQTLADRNFEQHHALEVFARAFGIQCPIIDRNREQGQVEERPAVPEEADERWNYTNPENPNQGPEDVNFFSTSPIQKRITTPTVFKLSTSPPPRFRNSKSPPRFHNSKSPPRFRNSTNSPLRFRNSTNSPQRFRNSPSRHRNSNSPPRNRQNRSVFERIGAKIPDSLDSPRNYDDWNDEYDNRATFRPYKIPSPLYVAPRDRSPESARIYRNRSRSRSLNRSPSRSPKRHRGGNKILSRRGRY
ncbi:hypothetical protein ACKWTF_009535 [Chironomus riparius]